MKVIKRDGSIVDYDSTKIIAAIEHANKEVLPEERIIKKDIRKIITYIEKLNKKRILVEDIQDIIEMKLMEMEKYVLAKKYIVYRYNRALVRKQNTTDESILSLIKNKVGEIKFLNPHKNAKLVSMQRDLIAGEVSKDLTKRILLPEKLIKAHELGVIHFHDTDYFLQPIFNSSFIDIEGMLDQGTVMNEKRIESPKSFQVACNIMTQIIASVASSQYGGQSISMKSLGKYLNISKQKFIEELKDENVQLTQNEMDRLVEKRLQKEVVGGIQTIEYQVNTLMTANGRSPSLTLFLELDSNDPYLEENALIIEEVFKRRLRGMENGDGEIITPEYPKLVYVLNEENTYHGGKFDYITDLAYECAYKRGSPSFLSSSKMKEDYRSVFSPMGEDHFSTLLLKEGDPSKGRFNQGVVTLNLVQIALLSKKNDEVFFDLLKERVELAVDALMRRHYALLGTSVEASPLHYQYGAISRLKEGTKIDPLLKGSASTLSLGYIGLSETVRLMRGTSLYEPSGKAFALKVLKFLKKKIDYAQVDTGCQFVLYATTQEAIGKRLCEIDHENLDDNPFSTYTPVFGLDSEVPYQERLKVEREYERLSLGGSISYVSKEEIKDVQEFIQFISETNFYVSLK